MNADINTRVKGENMNSNYLLRYIIEFDMLSSKMWYSHDFANNCPDEVRIAAYICFLGRFYRIASKDISENIRKYLTSTFSSMSSNNDLKEEKYISNIFDMTMNTLSASQQNVVLELDNRIKLLSLMKPYSGPRLSYDDTTEISKKSGDNTISTFTYDWSVENGNITEKLKMPFLTPHLIFVPLSLAFMTQFTINMLKDENYIPLLAKMIREVNATIPQGDRKYLLKTRDIFIQNKLL